MKHLLQRLNTLIHGSRQVMILCLLTCFIFSSPYVCAQDTALAQDTTVSADISTGLHFFNVSGYKGKVGEYDELKSGADTAFSVSGNRGKTYFDAYGEFFAQNDQRYIFNLDMHRILQTTFSYNRFIHYLDHDPLTNQNFYTDYDSNQGNHIIIEELKSGNTLMIPQLPFLKLKMDYRSYAKRGHRQATTVAKCSECHVTSNNQRINDRLDDIAVGLETTAGPATIQYLRHWVSFHQYADAPVTDYGDGASFFLVKGYNPYSMIPDTYTSIHEFRLRSLLPFSSSLFTSYQTGEKTNRDTRYNIDYHNVAARLSNYFLQYLTVDTFYNQYTMNNSAPEAIDRDYKRGGFDVSTAFLKRITVKLSYIWENTSRNNFYVQYTREKTFRLTANYRALRKLRFHFKYEKTRVSDPFVTRNPSGLQNLYVPALTATTMPQSADEYYLSASWNLRQDLTLNSSFRYCTGKNSRYNVDIDRYEFTCSFWYIPIEKLTITGAYTIYDNSVDTPVSYKRYHDTDYKSLFRYDDTPYDDQSQVYSLSSSYLLNHNLSLTGEVTYTRSTAKFDSNLNSSNIGNLSKLKIHRLDTAIGVNYRYSSRVTLSAKYLFREYNDKNNDALDGQFNGISVGINWSFR